MQSQKALFSPRKKFKKCKYVGHPSPVLSPHPDARFLICFQWLSVADRGFVSLLLAGVIFLTIAFIQKIKNWL